MAESICEKCKAERVNTYNKGVPRKILFCDTCWHNFCWARVDRPALWEQDNLAFVNGFIAGHIPAYPDNPIYQHALAIRALWRSRAKRVKQRAAMERSFKARQGDIELASQLLGEPYEKLKKNVFVDVSMGISALEARLEKLLARTEIYDRYLRHIRGPGIVSLAGIVGETYSARTVHCHRHYDSTGKVKPKLFRKCEHGKGEELDDALRLSQPNQRVYGISAFPASGNYCSFFGLGFRKAGFIRTDDGQEQEWYISDRPSAGEELTISLLRKTIAIGYLAGSFEKVPTKDRGPDTPWVLHYVDEKELKAAQWRKMFRYVPPPACSACIASKCKKCEGRGNWEKVDDPESGLWVCRDHHAGYWFGSPAHVRAHALRETASLFLKLLYHTWRHLEGLEEAPRHPLAVMHLH